jgi:ATP-binding cassette subfamily B (MDR/TAP) protein 1
LDGNDISSFNLRWLRQQISYVGQESILFNTSIHENIRLGLNNMTTSEVALTPLVIAAAKTANAHDFIISLPQGYQTEVGAKGLQISGGQRQRICIARCLIRNPKILLLDEATSALDVKSERAVQVALESAAKDRTTVVIAHRLSTIRNADNIIVMSQGSVVEQGQHDELMLQDGLYASLVRMQQIPNTAAEEAEEEDYLASERVLPELTTAEEKSDIVQIEEHSFTARGEKHGEQGKVIGDKTIKPSLWIYAQVVMELNRQEGLLIFGGLVFCIIAGLVIPVSVCVS